MMENLYSIKFPLFYHYFNIKWNFLVFSSAIKIFTVSDIKIAERILGLRMEGSLHGHQ